VSKKGANGFLRRKNLRKPPQSHLHLQLGTPGFGSQDELPTRNFFAPLRAADMEVERPVMEDTTQNPDGKEQQESSGKSGRQPPLC
jgi:hypothetical protein